VSIVIGRYCRHAPGVVGQSRCEQNTQTNSSEISHQERMTFQPTRNFGENTGESHGKGYCGADKIYKRKEEKLVKIHYH